MSLNIYFLSKLKNNWNQILSIKYRVRDYRESQKRYRNDVITFRVISNYPLKRPLQILFLSCKIIDLEFVYSNLLF